MPDDAIVFVIDDDVSIREALSSLIRSVGLGVMLFSSATEFLSFRRPDAPCCLVLDVRLPGLSGLELQQELKARGLGLPIVFITGHGDIPMSVRAIKAGAVEFLPKPFRDQDLLDAIQFAIARDQTRRQELDRLSGLRGRYNTLSPRERQVMAMLLTGQLNKQIGAVIGASESTVKAHRMQVMRKMGAASLVELIRMADSLGVEALVA